MPGRAGTGASETGDQDAGVTRQVLARCRWRCVREQPEHCPEQVVGGVPQRGWPDALAAEAQVREEHSCNRRAEQQQRDENRSIGAWVVLRGEQHDRQVPDPMQQAGRQRRAPSAQVREPRQVEKRISAESRSVVTSRRPRVAYIQIPVRSMPVTASSPAYKSIASRSVP
jgi:hypothetical protein